MSLEEMTEDQRLALSYRKLLNHPELGSQVKRLHKQAFPDAKFADIELEDKITAATDKARKELEALQERVQMQEIAGRRKEQHDKVRAAGLDPDAVEKVMTDEKISSYDTAIKYMRAQSASAQPSAASITPIRMPDNLADIQKDPRGWANKTAYEAINELVAKRGQG